MLHNQIQKGETITDLNHRPARTKLQLLLIVLQINSFSASNLKHRSCKYKLNILKVSKRQAEPLILLRKAGPYFGPVQPIVVPRPPLSLTTASLSKRDFTLVCSAMTKVNELVRNNSPIIYSMHLNTNWKHICHRCFFKDIDTSQFINNSIIESTILPALMAINPKGHG